MPIDDFIIALFCVLDQELHLVPQHPDAALHPSEVATLGVLYAMKGDSQRQFFQWIDQNYRHFFPKLPDRTNVFKQLRRYRWLADVFLAEGTLLGIADSYGVELRRTRRQGRRANQVGERGISNHRWIAGNKFMFLINQQGLVVDWATATANVYDGTFQDDLEVHDDMLVFTDMGFRYRQNNAGNLHFCRRGTWNERMMIERIFSSLTRRAKTKVKHFRSWCGWETWVGYLAAMVNIVMHWEEGKISLTWVSL